MNTANAHKSCSTITSGRLDPAQRRLCFHYGNTQAPWIDDTKTKGESLDWYPDPVKGYPRYLTSAVAPALGDNNDASNKHGITSSSNKENINVQPA